MHLIIGFGQPGDLDFTICSGQVIPAGAQVYATFSGADEHIDEHLFDAMKDEEHCSFCTLVQEARQREAKSQAEKVSARNLVGKLRGLFPGRHVATHTK